MKINRRLLLQGIGAAALMRSAKAVPVQGKPLPMSNCRVVTHGFSPAAVVLASSVSTADIVVDPADFRVAHIAAHMLADDVERITGKRPAVKEAAPATHHAVIIGTVGQSHWVDRLAKENKINISRLHGKWEASLWQTVDHPFPGVDRALVIAGSDRRGTAYGVMDLCDAAGVSPWYWWADVPVRRAEIVAVSAGRRDGGAPGVKYRGIFINDEDWGFEPWAAKTLDPKLGNVGPKTYHRVFELMLRLKLNYLWPAMHTCSTPFAAIAENSELANDYAIVMGSSHVEPMLANPASFLNGPNRRKDGPWNFVTNRRRIMNFWRQSARTRGKYEAIWTIGMRGPYDSPLEGVHTLTQERSLVEKIFGLQQRLIDKYVTPRWGPVAECYVPYKEALLVFNSGLEVPPDVTLVWPDNNFGYVRQLCNPQQRQRPGGSGVYYHIEYLGQPHSYCWLNTTPPALMWEELKKTWDNQGRTVWVINVGGIKPREIGVDFAARMAWNPAASGPDTQAHFLRSFAQRVCGRASGDAIADLMQEYYCLGQIRKPEFMNRAWASELSNAQASDLLRRYHALIDTETRISIEIPSLARNAYFQLFAYPAQMLAATGLVFMYDRNARLGIGSKADNQRQVRHWRTFMERQVWWYNHKLADGKWRHYATMGGTTYRAPWAAVQWPWLESQQNVPLARPRKSPLLTVSAADCIHQTRGTHGQWVRIGGLGWSGEAMALWPAVPQNRWNPEHGLKNAPQLRYQLHLPHAVARASIVAHVLPTYELYPGMQLRIAMQWNHQSVNVLAVPYASSETRVNSIPVRRHGVLNNHIPLQMNVGAIASGHHTLTLYAVDPGIVLDQITVEAETN